MKRRALIRHLEAHGCEFLREGRDHTVYVNRAAQKISTVPRHTEINDFLVERSLATCKYRGPEVDSASRY